MKFSPSSADRWLACAGSVPLSVGRYGEPNKYSAEGTVAHTVLETVLRLELEPEEMLGMEFEQDGFEFTVDQEMVDAVQFFLDYINRLQDGEIVIEKRIKGVVVVPGFNGLIDYAVIFTEREAILIDFKYGAGIMVDVIDNTQLLSYAVLLSILYPKLESVTLAVVQPRAREGGRLKETEVSRKEIFEFRDRVIAAKKKAEEADALPIAEQLERGYFVEGSHCRYCPAKAICPKLHGEALKAVGKTADDLPIFTPAGELDIETLVYWLDNAKLFRDWLDSLKEHGDSLLRDGKGVGHYKLVEAIANRRWNLSDVDLEKKLRSFGFTKKSLYKSALLSPAQVEKLVPPKDADRKAVRALLEELTHRPVLGKTMVPGDDRRDAVAKPDPRDDFAEFV